MLKTVQSVERALTLLELVDGAGSEGVSLSDLSAETGLKTPTAHNLLNTLLALDYVRRSERSKRYRLGRRALALGRGRTALDHLAAAAKAPLHHLNETLDETIILAVYSGGQRHTVLTLESHRDLRVGAKTGADESFYSTATGRCILAQLDPEEVEELTARLGSRADVWPDAASPAQFEAALGDISRAGVAELHKDHVEALAVPLLFSSSGMTAALGLYFPAVRGNSERRRTLADALCKAAREVQAEYERMRS